MTQVRFYALSNKEKEARLQFACRLIEKAYSLGHSIYIQAASAEQANTLDELLWQFNRSSFIPHGLADSESAQGDTIIIGDKPPASSHSDVLINLGSQVSTAHGQFARINEIISADEESLLQGRQRYRFYKEQGYQAETFKI